VNPRHQIQKIQKSYLLIYVLHYVLYDKNSQQSKHRGCSPVPYF
jgi:hypothetical protein